MKGEALSYPCDECGEVMVRVPGEVCDGCGEDYECLVSDASGPELL